MTIREFIKEWADDSKPDIDVYDDVVEELGIAYCSGQTLTKAGWEHFSRIMDYEIEIYYGTGDWDFDIAVVKLNDYEDWEERLGYVSEFFHSAAGYCADTDYNKWFKES